jgi:hypothetical protein
MSISSNTLFHFTSSVDNLISILRKDFIPRFSLENYSELLPNLPKFMKKIAIPMVCFCDIPLSLISEHISEYGSYGIGLTKKWGIKNKINPVIYAIKDTALCEYLNEIDKIFTRTLHELEEYYRKIKKPFNYNDIMLTTEIFGHVKPYEGRSSKTRKNKIFYNEREWRYIPSMSNFSNNKIDYRLYENEYNEIKRRELANKNIEHASIKLEFEPKDIKYLIVKKDNEIYNLIKLIDNIKRKFPHEDVEILKTKIISVEQLINDF